MGMTQIMGMSYKDLGYSSAKEMYLDLNDQAKGNKIGEVHQAEKTIDFFKSKSIDGQNMYDYLRSLKPDKTTGLYTDKEYEMLARMYNGDPEVYEGKENYKDKLKQMKRYADKLKRIHSKVVQEK